MARPLTVVPAHAVAAISDALPGALAGSATLCVVPHAPSPPGHDWHSALHLGEPVPPDVAALVATSGSTGAPRAVLLTAAALLASAHATLRRLSGPGAWLLALPLSSVGGLQVLVRSLMAGLHPVCLDPAASFHPDAFARAARDLPVGVPHYTSLVPTQLRRIVDAGGAALDALAGFDAVLIGGAPLDPELRAAATVAGARIVSTYGMTETSGGCVYDGIPLPGVYVDAPLGELRIGGDVIAVGYHAAPHDTQESFVDGWFLTRDAGQVDDNGVVSVTGRTDDVIISGGVKVVAGAVEQALRERADIADAAVLGRPDPEWGQTVIAVVVPVDGASIELDALRAYVAARLGTAAAPREVITVPALPRLHSGKLDRVAATLLLTTSTQGRGR
ncbi:MAG: o-succinylbenzoate--CoA ligase [Actinomycetota bacterium]|nr:o-succinylbenzoate--CoA ligase [Actinomycetota bacterium]